MHSVPPLVIAGTIGVGGANSTGDGGPVLNTTTSSNHTAKAKSLDPAKVLHTASVAAATSQFGWI